MPSSGFNESLLLPRSALVSCLSPADLHSGYYSSGMNSAELQICTYAERSELLGYVPILTITRYIFRFIKKNNHPSLTSVGNKTNKTISSIASLVLNLYFNTRDPLTN